MSYKKVCGRTVTYGSPVDPYGSTCDREPGHKGKHEGDDALAGGRVRWSGGYSVAGDLVPVRGLELVF